MEQMIDIVPSNWEPTNALIKVIGVGGGGCNAVNYMYNQHIEGCEMIVCNTDSQALQKSDVPIKIQLGEGLGAGTNPTKGRNAALESQQVIEDVVINTGTQMLFITAGMGGGTGTGASPVIAKMAKDKGILTVAVVTLPFKNEGDEFLSKAVDGIHELEKNVDSLLIINNENLYAHFGNQLIHEAFPKVDEILATAVKGIVEIIQKPGYVNVDFEDAKTMMKNSGLALMGYGTGSGKNRMQDALKGAFESPLLNDFDLKTAKNLLLNITVGKNENGVNMSELEQLTNMVTNYIGNVQKSKRGIILEENPEFGDRINITAIATGFQMNLIGLTGPEIGKLIMIDKNFTYKDFHQKHNEEKGEIDLGREEINVVKVGFNSSENVKKFHFEEGEVPCLIKHSGTPLAELEQTAAIRRASRQFR